MSEPISAEEAPDCWEGVTISGRYEPCERPAMGLRIDPEDGKPYPVCKKHLRPPFPAEEASRG